MTSQMSRSRSATVIATAPKPKLTEAEALARKEALAFAASMVNKSRSMNVLPKASSEEAKVVTKLEGPKLEEALLKDYKLSTAILECLCIPLGCFIEIMGPRRLQLMNKYEAWRIFCAANIRNRLYITLRELRMVL